MVNCALCIGLIAELPPLAPSPDSPALGMSNSLRSRPP
jgi:hypothetical protein